MTKCCAINLNARYRLIFKYSRDDTCVFSKNSFDFLHCIYIILSKTVVDDLLQCKKIEK